MMAFSLQISTVFSPNSFLTLDLRICPSALRFLIYLSVLNFLPSFLFECSLLGPLGLGFCSRPLPPWCLIYSLRILFCISLVLRLIITAVVRTWHSCRSFALKTFLSSVTTLFCTLSLISVSKDSILSCLGSVCQGVGAWLGAMDLFVSSAYILRAGFVIIGFVCAVDTVVAFFCLRLFHFLYYFARQLLYLLFSCICLCFVGLFIQ